MQATYASLTVLAVYVDENRIETCEEFPIFRYTGIRIHMSNYVCIQRLAQKHVIHMDK